MILVLTSCNQEKKLNGTWISAYRYSPKDNVRDYRVGDFSFNQILTFDNGTINVKDFDINYDETDKFRLERKRIIISRNQDTINDNIVTLTKDSIVFSYPFSGFNGVYKKLNDSLKNQSIGLKLTGKKFIRDYRKWSDTIHFVNDSIYTSSSWKIGNINRFSWKRINQNGFDILFTENYAPFVLKNNIGNTVFISAFGNRKEDYTLIEIE